MAEEDECVVVKVTGGEWPRGRANTSKVGSSQETVFAKGDRPWGWGMPAEGEQPRGELLAPGGEVLALGEQSLLAEGEQPRVGTPT